MPEIKVYVEFSLLDEDKNVCNRHIFVENPKVCKEGSCISIEKLRPLSNCLVVGPELLGFFISDLDVFGNLFVGGSEPCRANAS